MMQRRFSACQVRVWSNPSGRVAVICIALSRLGTYSAVFYLFNMCVARQSRVIRIKIIHPVVPRRFEAEVSGGQRHLTQGFPMLLRDASILRTRHGNIGEQDICRLLNLSPKISINERARGLIFGLSE